jgi:low temperature requirement protein LtrA
MNTQTLASPIGQRVTFVELFFDLVFVFSVTQVVGLFHHGVVARAAGQGLLVFWMIWWAWTQFTWTLNAADTTHELVELATLMGTAVAFFMGVAVPVAFEGHAAWFAVPYVLVRSIGLAIYGHVARTNPDQHAAVRTFTLLSIGGLLAVLVGGFTPGGTQYTMWGLAILLDVVAAAIAGRSEHWGLHAEHFVERHGLFVIIALGETLIVAAGGLTRETWSGTLVTIATLAIAITSALWWSYFTRAKPVLDHALESCHGSLQSQMARDAFSLAHFPVLCGVIAYAAALEQAIAHPGDWFALPTRIALALGVLLFVGGMAVPIRRCTGQQRRARVLLSIVTAAAIIALSGVAPAITLTIALFGVAAVAAWEQRTLPATAPAQPALPDTLTIRRSS